MDIDKRYLNKIQDSKTEIEMSALIRWPIFVTYEEDILFCKEKWNKKYDRYRPIFWDMTNVIGGIQ